MTKSNIATWIFLCIILKNNLQILLSCRLGEVILLDVQYDPSSALVGFTSFGFVWITKLGLWDLIKTE